MFRIIVYIDNDESIARHVLIFLFGVSCGIFNAESEQSSVGELIIYDVFFFRENDVRVLQTFCFFLCCAIHGFHGFCDGRVFMSCFFFCKRTHKQSRKYDSKSNDQQHTHHDHENLQRTHLSL